jgi:hypothetical protein
MNLSVGQLLGGAGIVANRMRATENDIMAQRELQLRTQEMNRLQEIRARMGEGAETAANVPPPRFESMPGTVVGDPNAPPPAANAPAANVPPANAPAANAPATTTTAPVRPPANVPATSLPPAPAAGLRTPQQLATVATNELTVAEFQALPPAERLRRLQTINRERQAAIDRAQLGKAPAAAADIVAGGPYNAIAQGGTWLANQLGVPRIGRALGIYDADVTRVEIPTVGTGSATPYYDMIRQTEQANRPLTEAQLLEQLKTGEATRTRAAEAERTRNVQAATQQGLADWQLDSKGKPVRGLANNNPGNIRPSTQYTWQGQVGIDKGPKEAAGFVQFSSPEAGIRAMTLNLLSYNQQGINTVQGIISRWAPESDRNATGTYIRDVAQSLGVKPTDVINIQDPAVMKQLVTAIIQKENGKQPYDIRTIDNGIALGFNKDTPLTAIATNVPPVRQPGGATTASAPPAVAVNNAVQTGTPTQVATAASNAVPVPTPSKDGTMYGPSQVDASAANPQIQQILTTRSALQRQVALFNQYGMGDKAWEAVSKIQAIDLGLYKNQADLGVYEGATTGNFSRAMSVLSTFTGQPHQVMRRPDGKFDLYVNGKVTKAALDGTQVELLVKTQVDSEYRQQLAKLQVERGTEEFKSNLRIREESSKQVLQTAREIQLKVIDGKTELAKKQLENAGFKLVGSGAGDGKAYYANGLGDVFVIDNQSKTVTINGTPVEVGVQAQRVAGVDRSIWSTVNPPAQEVR